jgi:hypothetical protein
MIIRRNDVASSDGSGRKCNNSASHRYLSITAAALLAASCTLEQKITAGVGLVTTMAAASPTTDVEQTYYVGIFDEHDQLDPAIYRLRVRGQASFLSQTKFASGWVRADVIDSLGSSASFSNNKGGVTIEKAAGNDPLARLKLGRRLVMFGPEGFAEAPADHRLVIVTGSNPEAFFGAVDTVLGEVSGAIQSQRVAPLREEFLSTLATLAEIRRALDLLGRDLAVDATVKD